MNIKMNYFKIKTSFVRPEGPKARCYITGIDFMIYIFMFVGNCLLYDAIHDFSVRLRTGSNPADIIRLGNHTGKHLIFVN